MASSTSKPQYATIAAYQAQHVSRPPPALLIAHWESHRQKKRLDRNEKARIRMAAQVLRLVIIMRRAELKNSSPEEQEHYAARARASQARYREKHRELLAVQEHGRRYHMHHAVHGIKATRVWVKKLTVQREHREAIKSNKERRLQREARWAARTAARSPPDDPERSDNEDSDHDSFDDLASADGSE
ncbi:hypothetical protein C8J57DRAFT_1223909 [Mycena rebaudengoi]|nr:hypothetical protein C8J57DRAFT_1223909 [Mycena rebaudengoi]